MDEKAIIVKGLSKTFRLPHEKAGSLKNMVVTFWRRQRGFELQKVLSGLSFEVKKGEFFGIVGRNGSGKSTLLKLLAGIYTPSRGTIDIKGSLTPFIELGVGFNQELSGRDNVYLNGSLLGFSRREMAAMYDDIVDFAELHRFMDQKLKNYSSGMQVRLAFSIAIKANSDILLLDEVLAVGDAAFQKKCFDHFRKLKKDKKTVVFISHDMTAIRDYCDRVALIENGEIKKIGTPDKVTQEYAKLFVAAEHQSQAGEERWGNRQMLVSQIDTKLTDKLITITVDYQVHADTEAPIFGLSITSPTGLKLFESNTKWHRVKTGNYAKGSRCRVTWEVPNIFTNGLNFITTTAANADASEFYDWWDEAATFDINKEEVTSALTLPDFSIKLSD